MAALGIPIALVGSVFLAIGAQLQHRGVNKVDAQTDTEGKTGLGIGQLFALIRRPSWMFGTLLLALAIVCQLVSLYLAPLTVVQPLGVLALVITSVVNSRVSKTPLDGPTIRAIAYCVLGVGIFVTIAALTTKSVPIHDAQLKIILFILVIVLVLLGLAFVLFRKRFNSNVFYIIAAGVLFGFVATLAKADIDRINTIVHEGFHLRPEDSLAIVAFLALIVAGLLGSYFVQTAHASGPPDLVVAGLTVIDPIVGVTLGIVVLGEATGAPWWSAIVFVVAGALAIYGVFQLAKYHPQNAV
jgi:hypothetical protein